MARDLIPRRGAVGEPLIMEVIRELTPGDLTRLHEAPKVGVPVLQRLRAVHHRQAQLLAQGKPIKEIAITVGCTTARLTQLQKDPTFMELVTYYMDQINVQAIEDAQRIQTKIVDIGEMAIDELQTRLEDDAQRSRIQTDQIRKIAEFAMDRTVAPPKAAPNAPIAPSQVTINFGTTLRDTSLDEGGAPAPLEGTVADGQPIAYPTEPKPGTSGRRPAAGGLEGTEGNSLSNRIHDPSLSNSRRAEGPNRESGGQRPRPVIDLDPEEEAAQ